MEGKKDLKKIFASSLAIVGWVTILLQLYLIIENRQTSIPETIIRFFSYFTILTNILVAAYLTMQHDKSRTAAAVLLYIVIVGLVYNIILRPLWNPQGLQKWVDESLHTFIPLLFLWYWFLFAPKQNLQWKNVGGWLLFPLIYLIVVMIRGSFSHFYPYPFLNADEHGYTRVLLNCIILLIPFLLIGLAIVAIAKRMSKPQS